VGSRLPGVGVVLLAGHLIINYKIAGNIPQGAKSPILTTFVPSYVTIEMLWRVVTPLVLLVTMLPGIVL